MNTIEFVRAEHEDHLLLDSTDLKVLPHPKIGHLNGWYAFKILLKKSPNNNPIVFNIEGNSIDSIRFYDGDKKLITSIERMTLRSHSYKIIPSSDSYYATVHFKKQAYFPLRALTLENYYQYQNKFFFTNGLFYGFVFIVLVINLIFYVALKDQSFLTYALFLGLTNLAITDFDGLMGLFTTPQDRFYVSTLLHFIVPATTALFTSTILGHHKSFPKSVSITAILLIVSSLSYFSFLVFENFLFSAIGDLIGLIIVTFYMYLGVLELKKQKFAKFTVFGYCLIWVSAILYMMPLNFGIEEPSVSIETVKLGSVLDMLVLTYSIVYRMKLLHLENQQFSKSIKTHVQKIFELEIQLENTQLESKIGLSTEEKVAEIASQNNLTTRETDVLLQIILGLNNPEIAEKLFVSVNTVKYHTRNIYEKLDVKKRAELTSKHFLT